MSLKYTPLYDNHIALKAKMVPFGGWEMPVQYEGIIAEYEATRKHVAMYDICHMGEFFIQGDAISSGLDRIVTQRLVDLSVGSCRYGMMLNDNGGVIDDLIVFRIASEEWMVVVNAATAEKDAAHFRSHLSGEATFEDRSDQTGKIDVQGPEARDFLKPLVAQIEKLEYYTFDTFEILGEKVIVSRTGYTGELGYEIYVPWLKIRKLWDQLLKMGAVPAGLGARDLLRIEMGYPLYGHEITEDIFPVDAGLSRFIDLEKDFIGKTPLLQYKNSEAKRKMICFVAESRRSPRAGQQIFSDERKNVGVVTSGTFSPALKLGVGLGFVPSHFQVDQKIFFGADQNMIPAQIVSRPIYKNSSLKA